MSRALLQQALDALTDSVDDSRSVLAQHLENYGTSYRPDCAKRMQQTVNDVEAAISALRAALALPEPDPAAWLDPWTRNNVTTDYDAYGKHGVPLYTRPAKPLTDEQIEDMRGEANRGYNIEREDYFKAVRDAEIAHGIRPAPEVRRARPDDTEGGEA